MVNLSPDDRTQLLNLLTPLPGLEDARGREAVLIRASLQELRPQMDIDGASAVAIPRMVDFLCQYGKVTDEYEDEALGRFLNALKEYVGIEKRESLDRLIRKYLLLAPMAAFAILRAASAPEKTNLSEQTIFISYVRERDGQSQPYSQHKWVQTLIKELREYLSQNLGYSFVLAPESNDTLKDVNQDVIKTLKSAALLLIILSREYLASGWCQKKRNNFLSSLKALVETGVPLLIIERDQIEELPAEFQGARNYRFWIAQSAGEPSSILEPQDQRYYEVLTDVGNKLVQEFRRPAASAETSSEDHAAAQTARATVFLADVTGDLHFRREEVKRALQQADIRVLPDDPYPSEVQAFQNAVRDDLQKSKLFIQLLSAIPERRPKELPRGYACCQYELALEMGKTVLQWRSPDLLLEQVQDPQQRDFLQGEHVHAVGIEEFKREIINTLFPPQPRKRSAGQTPLVFIKSETSDADLADNIRWALQNTFQVNSYAPTPTANSRLVKRWVLKSHGIMLVYGNVNVEWVEQQYLDLDDILGQQEPPLPLFVIYDGPPEEKPRIPFAIQSIQILPCRDCPTVKEEELRKFVNALQEGGKA